MCGAHIGVKNGFQIDMQNKKERLLENKKSAESIFVFFRRITVTSPDFSSPAYPALRVKGNVENPLPSRCRF